MDITNKQASYDLIPQQYFQVISRFAESPDFDRDEEQTNEQEFFLKLGEYIHDNLVGRGTLIWVPTNEDEFSIVGEIDIDSGQLDDSSAVFRRHLGIVFEVAELGRPVLVSPNEFFGDLPRDAVESEIQTLAKSCDQLWIPIKNGVIVVLWCRCLCPKISS